jgi:hypothetical protein
LIEKKAMSDQTISTVLDCIINPKKVVKHLWRKTNWGSLTLREEFDAFHKPQYAWGMLQAVKIAKSLGVDHILALEFGVATGGGLRAMDELAVAIRKEFGVRIDCYGFDTGQGLTKPADFRDAPYHWKEGEFSPLAGDMHDFSNLRSKLVTAKLVIGDVKETVGAFCRDMAQPIGFISFDLDLYTSTRDAFQIFGGSDAQYLPRVPLYFDDVSGTGAFCNEFMGELLAINEFNAQRPHEKIGKINGFELYRKIPSAWNIGAYMYHRYTHPHYDQYSL